jgi:hypothetical protein
MAYRILSMDGGGSWALIEVEALIKLFGGDKTGHEVLGEFDMVAANSGGSLVLAGLVENLKLTDLRSYFLDEAKRRSIFSRTSSVGDRVLHELTGLGPKYDAEGKLPALERQLPRTGNTLLPDAAAGVKGHGGKDIHLLIIGFDYDHTRATYFRSAPVGGGKWGSGAVATVTLAQAVHASTNAPVNYFDAPATIPGCDERYWDGGITGCNNPVLAAVTEAIVMGRKPTEIVALSLGTGTVRLPLAAPGARPSSFEAPWTDPSLVADLRKLATSILDDPPDAATFIAHVATGGPVGVPESAHSRVVRMNPLIRPIKDSDGNWAQPSGMTPAQFKFLCRVDMDAVEANEVAAIAHYTELWLADGAPNQPIRADGRTFEPEIGFAKFSQARAAWQTVLAEIK